MTFDFATGAQVGGETEHLLGGRRLSPLGPGDPFRLASSVVVNDSSECRPGVTCIRGVPIKGLCEFGIPHRPVLGAFFSPQDAFVLEDVADLFAMIKYLVGYTSAGYYTNGVRLFVAANDIFCSRVGSGGHFRVRCEGDVISGWDACPFEVVRHSVVSICALMERIRVSIKRTISPIETSTRPARMGRRRLTSIGTVSM